MARETMTGGRAATAGVIPGRWALSVGNPGTRPRKGFRWVELASIARLESGHTPSRRNPEYWDGEIPWIGIRDATANHGKTIYSTNQSITHEGIANSSARLLPAGTVCLSRTASVGYVVTTGVPMATSQDFVNWVCGPEIHPRYLHYILVSEQDSIRRFAHGSVHPTVYYPEAKAFYVCIPDRGEQENVVAVLGALDDKISANESGVRTAHRLMRLHYRLAIAQGSTTTTLSKIAVVFDGPHATPEKTVVGPWFLSISSLQDGHLVLDESAHVAEHDFTRWTRRVTPTAGDVLFSYETRLGEAALMPGDVRACLGRRMALLRPHTGIGARTLLQAYLSESFQETIKQRSVHGATVDRIPLTELPAWPITLPNGAERLEDLLGGLDDMAAQRDRENETLAELRDTLLPRLISGEIRVRDAEKVIEEVL